MNLRIVLILFLALTNIHIATAHIRSPYMNTPPHIVKKLKAQCRVWHKKMVSSIKHFSKKNYFKEAEFYKILKASREIEKCIYTFFDLQLKHPFNNKSFISHIIYLDTYKGYKPKNALFIPRMQILVTWLKHFSPPVYCGLMPDPNRHKSRKIQNKLTYASILRIYFQSEQAIHTFDKKEDARKKRKRATPTKSGKKACKGKKDLCKKKEEIQELRILSKRFLKLVFIRTEVPKKWKEELLFKKLLQKKKLGMFLKASCERTDYTNCVHLKKNLIPKPSPFVKANADKSTIKLLYQQYRESCTNNDVKLCMQLHYYLQKAKSKPSKVKNKSSKAKKK